MDETVAAQAFVPFVSAPRDTGAPGPGFGLFPPSSSAAAHIRVESEPSVGTPLEIRLAMNVGARRAHGSSSGSGLE